MNKLLICFMLFCALLSSSVSVVGSSTKNQDGTVLLKEENVVNFRGVVDSVSTTAAMLELARLDTLRGKKDYPIYLVLDTPGGNVQDGLSFIQFAKSIKNLHTITIFAASMGSAIVEHLPGERLILENGVLMFHRAAGGFEGQFNDGEVESQLAFWKSIITDMEQKNADRMGMELKDYKEKSRDELWIYGPNTITQKAADRIISIKCTDELIKSTEISTINLMFFSLDAEYSKCPLFTNALRIIETKE